MNNFLQNPSLFFPPITTTSKCKRKKKLFIMTKKIKKFCIMRLRQGGLIFCSNNTPALNIYVEFKLLPKDDVTLYESDKAKWAGGSVPPQPLAPQLCHKASLWQWKFRWFCHSAQDLKQKEQLIIKFFHLLVNDVQKCTLRFDLVAEQTNLNWAVK